MEIESSLLYNPGRIDDDIHRSQIFIDLRHRIRNRLLVPDVDVEKWNGDPRRRVQFCRGRVPEFLLHVQQGDGFGAGFGEGEGHVVA